MSESNRSDEQVITPALLRRHPLPVPDGGKGDRGTVLVVGGSRSTPGAVLLAGLAALRAGAGVLQLAAAGSTAAALSIAVPEALVLGLPETEDGSVAGTGCDRLAGLTGQADAVLIGPGLDDVDETLALLRTVLGAVGERTDLVLDAYALGALSRDPALTRRLRRPAVLTPNPTEAGYLLDGARTGVDRADRRPGRDEFSATAAAIADRYRCVVALRGHVVSPDGGRWREEAGDSGLGTSGSGDVLAGIAAGLLARGADPASAAIWASHLHAMAGQRLARMFGRVGFLARELVDEVRVW